MQEMTKAAILSPMATDDPVLIRPRFFIISA